MLEEPLLVILFACVVIVLRSFRGGGGADGTSNNVYLASLCAHRDPPILLVTLQFGKSTLVHANCHMASTDLYIGCLPTISFLGG